MDFAMSLLIEKVVVVVVVIIRLIEGKEYGRSVSDFTRVLRAVGLTLVHGDPALD
jgi:hypothetical protein